MASEDQGGKVRWLTADEAAELPEDLQPWVVEREGWTPITWGCYLCERIVKLEGAHPKLAESWERAIALMRGEF